MATKTPALLQPKRIPTAAEMTQDIAPPSSTGVTPISSGSVRKAVETNFSLEFSPSQVMRALRSAQEGKDLSDYIRIANIVLRRSAKLRSLMSSRVLAVTGLPKVVTPGGTKAKDKKAAEACQALASTPAFKQLVRHLAWASYFGYASAQTIYDTSNALQWGIQTFKPLKQEWFAFDPVDGMTPLLLSDKEGEAPQPLDVFGKYVFHTPTLMPGQPYLNGIAYTAVFYAALTHVVLKQGTQFVELFGQPMRLGKYRRGNGDQHKKELAVLRKALENLGADAWAMIPDDMQIEFLKDATVGGSIETYEKWARYFDELLAGLIQGGNLNSGTGNTGSGGSQSLGLVHREGFYDLVRADADDLADTITRDVFAAYTYFNFGPEVAVPHLSMQVEEAEDVTAWVDATDKAMNRGLRVPAAEFYKRLNIAEPKDGDEVLGGAVAQEQTQQPAPQSPVQQNSAQSLAAESDTDEIDSLIAELEAEEAFQAANEQADRQLLEALDNATNAAQLREALIAVVKTGDVSALQAVLTAGTTAARVAGDEGIEIGDK